MEQILREKGLTTRQIQQVLETIEELASYNELKREILRVFEDNPNTEYNIYSLQTELDLPRKYNYVTVENALFELLYVDEKIENKTGRLWNLKDKKVS